MYGLRLSRRPLPELAGLAGLGDYRNANEVISDDRFAELKSLKENWDSYVAQGINPGAYGFDPVAENFDPSAWIHFTSTPESADIPIPVGRPTPGATADQIAVRSPAAQMIKVPEGYSVFRDARDVWTVAPSEIVAQLPLVPNFYGEASLPYFDVYELSEKYGLNFTHLGNGIYFTYRDPDKVYAPFEVAPEFVAPVSHDPPYNLPPPEAENIPGYTLFYRRSGSTIYQGQVTWTLMPSEMVGPLNLVADEFGYLETAVNPVSAIVNDGMAVSAIGMLVVIWYLDQPPPIAGLQYKVPVGAETLIPVELTGGTQVVPGETIVSNTDGSFNQFTAGPRPITGPGSFIPAPIEDDYAGMFVNSPPVSGGSQLPRNTTLPDSGAVPVSLGKILGLASLAFVGLGFIGKKKPSPKRRRIRKRS